MNPYTFGTTVTAGTPTTPGASTRITEPPAGRMVGSTAKTPKSLTRAQRYAAAVRVCKKIKSKHKRATCLATAKKRYGPKNRKAAKTKKGSRAS